MSSSKAMRILLADDHPVVREGLKALINRSTDMTVVAEANDGREAMAEYLRHRPDVTLMDLRMPELDGVDAIVGILKEAPASRIIVLTTYDDDEDIYRALRAGARGYILKDAPRDTLLGCIRTVHAGQMFVDEGVAAKLADRLGALEPTPRELDVLRLIAEGRANKAIAISLGISEGTVKTHVNSLLRKLEADDRTHAVTLALRRGIFRLQ